MAPSRTFWLLTAALVLQLGGAAVDGVWHLSHHHGASAPGWVHLPIHLGIGLLVIAALVWVVLRLPSPGARPLAVLVGATVQAGGDAWSLAVDAEERGFHVPVVLIVVGGAVAFTAALLPQVGRAWRSVGAQSGPGPA